MNAFAWSYVAISLLLLPVLIASVDAIGVFRAKLVPGHGTGSARQENFTILVPIYGSIRYLENVEYLATYGKRVMLCTTNQETPEFTDALLSIAQARGFQTFFGETGRPRVRGDRRDTGGTTRDRIVRDALATVRTTYVVCLDADTVTERPIGELVGAIEAGGYDVVSVPLVPLNRRGMLAKLQAHEYRLAMTLRRIVPWLVSGGCHGGRTAAMAHVMRCHSLFFQGNDVETGLLAQLLGYRTGHIAFPVPTVVPSTPRAWFRQRLAWAGGEFRLFVVNIDVARRHPFMWLYGVVIMFGGLYFRWYTALTVPVGLVAVLVIYELLVLAIHWRQRDGWLLLLPLYTAFNSLIMIAFALPSYVWMAVKSRNSGRIRSQERGPRTRAGRPPAPPQWRRREFPPTTMAADAMPPTVGQAARPPVVAE